jgi:hypothetical protein
MFYLHSFANTIQTLHCSVMVTDFLIYFPRILTSKVFFFHILDGISFLQGWYKHKTDWFD